MSFLSRIGFKPKTAAPRIEPAVLQAATSGTRNPDKSVFDIGWHGSTLGSSKVKRLPRATPTLAQRHATVFACCNNIAGDLAKVPLQIYEQQPDGTEQLVTQHAASYLLNVESAPNVSAKLLRFQMVYAFALRGRSPSYAPRTGAGELELVEFINPDRVTMLRSGRDRFFDFEDGAEVRRRVPASAMVFLRYMPIDGWTGRSPIEVAAESFGLALAGQEAAARTATGGTARAVLKVHGAYESDEDRVRNQRALKNAIDDPEANGFPIIEHDEEVEVLDLSAADQELLASRKFDREQIAATYRMPPSKLQMLEHGVKANGQQQAIDYLTDCLMHWSSLVEAEMAMGLLTRGERERGLVFRHDFSALLQPTTQELYTALNKAVGGPFMTANQAQRTAKLPVTNGPDDDKLNPAPNMTAQPQSETSEEDENT
ncbi:MAG: phage portal protein [Pseudomonadota bacterium]